MTELYPRYLQGRNRTGSDATGTKTHALFVAGRFWLESLMRRKAREFVRRMGRRWLRDNLPPMLK
jgi:hypothetical protein